MTSRRWAGAFIGFVAWLYLALIGLLTLWLLMVVAATGWRPIIITGGSMQPALQIGDVLLVDDHPDDLVGQRTVITYRDRAGTGLVTHRVYEVLPESQTYLTKGDANQSVDTDPVPVGQVVGVGRLAIPLIGLPAVWLQQGQLMALSAMAIVSIAAVAAALLIAHASRQTGEKNEGTVERSSELADRGVRRLRVLAAILIAADQYLDRSEEVVVMGWGPGRAQIVVLALAGLLAVNVFSSRVAPRLGWPAAVTGRVELGVDTIISISLIALHGSAGIGWAVITLPILEATIRYRMAGALAHWTLMAFLTMAGRLFILDHSDASLGDTIYELEQQLDQFGVLLLIIVPGAYLIEQLIGDVLLQNRATAEAAARARVLERVAETGYELNRLGTELFTSLTQAVTDLGFHRADALLLGSDGQWRELAATERALPAPGAGASGLREADLALTEVVVDADDPEMSEVVALAENDLSQLARLTLSTEQGLHVVLRAGAASNKEVDTGVIDALRLLVGQAAVALQNRQLVSELQDTQAELAHQASHDALTGLPNRSRFLSSLDAAVDADDGYPHIVMFLDLNGFKGVNDTLGHEVGDALLINVARRLVKVIGDRGLVARLGGDEFTIHLDPAANSADGSTNPEELAGRVALEVHDTLIQPYQIGDQTVTVGASIGIAIGGLDAGPGVEVETETDGGPIVPDGAELVRRADVSMYAAKRSAEVPRIMLYHSALDDDERQRTKLTADFRKALDTGGLWLAYQPILTSRGGHVRGVEALLRWDHAEYGPVGSGTIIELAESADLTESLTRWVFHTAMAEIGSCGIDPNADFLLALNVSPAEASSTRLVSTVLEGLTLSGMPPSWVVVELSERMVADGDAPMDNLHGLVELGVGLALDDFGQGQTSLVHLRELPIGWLKLDLALVQQAATADTDRVILNSVVDLGHQLGLQVIAEGVETEAHLRVTLDGGADLLQGFGLYRPLPLHGLRAVLADEGLLVDRHQTGPSSAAATGSRVGADGVVG